MSSVQFIVGDFRHKRPSHVPKLLRPWATPTTTHSIPNDGNEFPRVSRARGIATLPVFFGGRYTSDRCRRRRMFSDGSRLWENGSRRGGPLERNKSVSGGTATYTLLTRMGREMIAIYFVDLLARARVIDITMLRLKRPYDGLNWFLIFRVFSFTLLSLRSWSNVNLSILCDWNSATTDNNCYHLQ